MADVIGTAMGAVSLCIQLVDGIAKGYRFYLSAVGMPASCLTLRVQLGMQYQRILSWTEAAGLLEYEEGQEIPEVLRTSKDVLLGVLSQIRALIEEFAEGYGKYKQLSEITDHEFNEAKRQIDLVGEFSNIFDREKKVEQKRRYFRGANHIMRGVKNAKDIATDPRRLVWVAFDADYFQKMLVDLTTYNDYLDSLLQGQRARALIEITKNTFAEVVAVRESIKQLVTLAEATKQGGLRANGSETILQSLAAFRAANLINDAPSCGNDTSAKDQNHIKQQSLVSSDLLRIKNTAKTPLRLSADRPLATWSQHGIENDVWIEWKHYGTQASDNYEDDDVVPRETDRRRTQELVALLQMNKPIDFCVPRCLGYFDDATGPFEPKSLHRFGLIFDMASWSHAGTAVVSLLQLISDPSTPTPALEDRIAIASKLALTIQYLHTVQWLHKGIRSDNILFTATSAHDKGDSNTATTNGNSHAPHNSINFTSPLLSGFEFARPDRSGATYTGTFGPQEESWDLYKHPDCQGPAGQGHFRKTADVYALGIVLLEVAFWQPIQHILGHDGTTKLANVQRKGIRKRILDDEDGLKGRLRARVGAKYAESVFACIRGCAALGIAENEDQMTAAVGVRLQRAFISNVSAPLTSVFRG